MEIHSQMICYWSNSRKQYLPIKFQVKEGQTAISSRRFQCMPDHRIDTDLKGYISYDDNKNRFVISNLETVLNIGIKQGQQFQETNASQRLKHVKTLRVIKNQNNSNNLQLFPQTPRLAIKEFTLDNILFCDKAISKNLQVVIHDMNKSDDLRGGFFFDDVMLSRQEFSEVDEKFLLSQANRANALIDIFNLWATAFRETKEECLMSDEEMTQFIKHCRTVFQIIFNKILSEPYLHSSQKDSDYLSIKSLSGKFSPQDSRFNLMKKWMLANEELYQKKLATSCESKDNVAQQKRSYLKEQQAIIEKYSRTPLQLEGYCSVNKIISDCFSKQDQAKAELVKSIFLDVFSDIYVDEIYQAHCKTNHRFSNNVFINKSDQDVFTDVIKSLDFNFQTSIKSKLTNALTELLEQQSTYGQQNSNLN